MYTVLGLFGEGGSIRSVVNKIGDILSGIGDFFVNVGQFIVNIVKDLVDIVKLLGSAKDMVLGEDSPIMLFPASFITMFGVIIVVVILYKVVGREG